MTIPGVLTVAPAARSCDMLDMTPVVARLEAIERHLAVAPERVGAAVGEATLTGYCAAGLAHAQQLERAGRRNG